MKLYGTTCNHMWYFAGKGRYAPWPLRWLFPFIYIPRFWHPTLFNWYFCENCTAWEYRDVKTGQIIERRTR